MQQAVILNRMGEHGSVRHKARCVLVVEDELPFAQTIELYLRKENYRTERAADGEKAIELFRRVRPDLVILDLGLPVVDGLTVLRTVRAEGATPVIILTARAEEVDELLGLGLGADAYLVKPVSARRLMAHVEAVFRRAGPNWPDLRVARAGTIEIDDYARRAIAGGQVLCLTPSEFRILAHLAATPGRAVSRVELLEAALPASDAYERAIDIHITNLRRKLREAGAGEPLETVRGFGYRLNEE